MPVRIQRERTDGWRLPAGAVVVTRPGMFGNPFRVGDTVCMKTARKWGWKVRWPNHVCADAQEAVKRFTLALGFDDCMKDWVRKELKGKDLACFCPLDQPCHADVLLQVANSEAAGEFPAAGGPE